MKQCEGLAPIAVNVAEAARLVGVSRPTMARWTHLPGFPVVRLGGIVRIPLRDLEDWLRKQEGAAV